MALVDADTGVKIADLTPDEARELTERIKSTAELDSTKVGISERATREITVADAVAEMHRRAA